MLRFLAPPLALGAVLLWAGCDSDDPDTLTFDGVEIEARGGAELATEGGDLVVSNVQASGDDGFFIAGTPTAVDVRTEPLPLTLGQGFGISVIGTDGAELVGFRNVNRGASGRVTFEITYADALDVKAVRVVYLLNGRAQLEIPNLPFGTGSGLRLATDSAGEGEGDTESAHVVRRGGKYVVVSDSEGEGEPRRAGDLKACEGFTVTPPIEIPTVTLCADRIEVEPLNVTFPDEVAGVAVTGRSLGSFRVRSLASR